jgi:hypothetical protein
MNEAGYGDPGCRCQDAEPELPPGQDNVRRDGCCRSKECEHSDYAADPGFVFIPKFKHEPYDDKRPGDGAGVAGVVHQTNLAATQGSVHTFEEAKGILNQFLFHPDGRWLAALGGDNGGLVQFYDLAEKKLIKGEKAPMHVHATALDEDATRLFAAGHGKVVVWEL